MLLMASCLHSSHFNCVEQWIEKIVKFISPHKVQDIALTWIHFNWIKRIFCRFLGHFFFSVDLSEVFPFLPSLASLLDNWNKFCATVSKMSVKKLSSVGLQIEAPSPTPEKFNYDIELVNLPKWVQSFPSFILISKRWLTTCRSIDLKCLWNRVEWRHHRTSQFQPNPTINFIWILNDSWNF